MTSDADLTGTNTELKQWLEFCAELKASDFSSTPGITPEQVFTTTSIKALSEHLQNEYADSADVPAAVRREHEGYLGEFAIQQLGGKWVVLNEQEHGLDGLGVFINSEAGYVIPQELWKLLFDAPGTAIVETTLSAN